MGRAGTPDAPYRGGGCKPGRVRCPGPPHGCALRVRGAQSRPGSGRGGRGGAGEPVALLPLVARGFAVRPGVEGVARVAGACRVPPPLFFVWPGFQCRRRAGVASSIPSVSMSLMASSYPSFQPSMWVSSYSASHASHGRASAGSRHRVLDTCIGSPSAPSMVRGRVSVCVQ